MSTSAPHNKELHAAMQGAYGLFLMIWGVFETIIEVAIARQLGIDFLRGNIVTSGLAFERRASVLRSLLALHGERHAEPIKLITQIAQEASRNALIHGMVFVGEKELTFVKRDTSQELRVTEKTFSVEGLLKHVTSIRIKVEQLQPLLSVSDDDLHAFGTAARNLSKRSSTSPHAPASKASK